MRHGLGCPIRDYMAVDDPDVRAEATPLRRLLRTSKR